MVDLCLLNVSLGNDSHLKKYYKRINLGTLNSRFFVNFAGGNKITIGNMKTSNIFPTLKKRDENVMSKTTVFYPYTQSMHTFVLHQHHPLGLNYNVSVPAFCQIHMQHSPQYWSSIFDKLSASVIRLRLTLDVYHVLTPTVSSLAKEFSVSPC